ncbi:MAG: ELWxxDGT repeat protein [Sulfuricaulis sp.]
MNGAEPWKTDGTTAGTVMVKDVNPAAGVGSSPSGFTVLNEALYFSANDGVSGVELWKTDGTAVGTQLLKDICPGLCDGVLSWR